MAVFTGTSCFPVELHSMDDFEQACGAHAATDAHRHNRVFRLAPAALDQGVARQTRTGHAIGMTTRDPPAVHVELFRIDAELVAAIDHLHRERLVQLPEIDIVDGQAVSFEKPRHGVDRTDPHLVRLAARRDKPAEDTKRLETLLRGDLVAHDDRGTGSVRKLARIAAGDGKARSLAGPDRPQPLAAGSRT